MIRIELGVEDLANTRFGISPIAETVHSLRALADPSDHTLHLPWLRAVRGHLDQPRAARAELHDVARHVVQPLVRDDQAGDPLRRTRHPPDPLVQPLRPVRELDGDEVEAAGRRIVADLYAAEAGRLG